MINGWPIVMEKAHLARWVARYNEMGLLPVNRGATDMAGSLALVAFEKGLKDRFTLWRLLKCYGHGFTIVDLWCALCLKVRT